MAQSGALMAEVGTTNRTKLADYERAINEQTKMILRVHPSNYRIVGFTHAPALAELAALAHARGLVLYEDAGSGVLADLSALGLRDEPVIGASVAQGADLVTFSGDKLLGGPQAGLLVGRRTLVEECRRHPLYRALRADKLALAALEATLGSYRRGEAAREVPALRMLAATRDEIEQRVRDFVETRVDDVRPDETAHRLRLQKLIRSLVEEFNGDEKPADEIRACADAVLAEFADVPVRSFVLTLAHRRARECLRDGSCAELVASI
jgi:L-seryl-tRNA(Ser) seleniumtransferase